jgi:hypothetical protein
MDSEHPPIKRTLFSNKKEVSNAKIQSAKEDLAIYQKPGQIYLSHLHILLTTNINPTSQPKSQTLYEYVSWCVILDG